jgi:hypothetical protein
MLSSKVNLMALSMTMRQGTKLKILMTTLRIKLRVLKGPMYLVVNLAGQEKTVT